MARIAERKGLYKVVKVMRGSANRYTLERNLSLDEAQRCVKKHPDSKKHIVVYFKQGE